MIGTKAGLMIGAKAGLMIGAKAGLVIGAKGGFVLSTKGKHVIMLPIEHVGLGAGTIGGHYQCVLDVLCRFPALPEKPVGDCVATLPSVACCIFQSSMGVHYHCRIYGYAQMRYFANINVHIKNCVGILQALANSCKYVANSFAILFSTSN